MAGAVLEGVLVDEPIEVVRQLAGHFGWATGAGAIHQALHSLVGKAMDPLAQRGIGKVQRVGHRLEAVPLDDLAHGLGTAEDAGLLGLLEEGIQGGERLLGKVEFEGPHRGGLREKLLQKFTGGTCPIDPLIGTKPFRLKFLWSCLWVPPRLTCVTALCCWPQAHRHRGLPVLLTLQYLPHCAPLSRSEARLHSRYRGPAHGSRPDDAPDALDSALFGGPPQGSTTGLWLVPDAVELCHAGGPTQDET